MNRTIRKASECKIARKSKDLLTAVKDKQSGKSAWMISIGAIKWKSDQEAQIGARRYCGAVCMWSSVLQATLINGKWKVDIAPGASVFVS